VGGPDAHARASSLGARADTDTPATHPREAAFFENLGAYWLGEYWLGPELWGRPASPVVLSPTVEMASSASSAAAPSSSLPDSPSLRSARRVTGYAIRGVDAYAGHLVDVMIDDAAWTVCYLVVNTGPGRLGHEVLVAPSSVAWVSWLEQAIHLDLRIDALRHTPRPDPVRSTGDSS
jgi:hypothetical protein